MTKDLTRGNEAKALLLFALPLMGSMLFQQLYNIADSFVAGKFIGNQALAAVSNSYEMTLIFLAFATGCNMGSSVLVSQLFGAKRHDALKSAIVTIYVSCAVLCGLLMLGGFFSCNSLLRLIHTPAEIFSDSALYLRIYIAGLPFLFFYNIATGIFSAMGNSKTPFFFLAASSVTNIFMNILFVTAFDMGVSGVAWATFLCQGCACILANIVLLRSLRELPKGMEKPQFSKKILRTYSVLAIPGILQQSCVSIGNLLIQALVNRYDSPGMIAGFGAAMKLNTFCTLLILTLANAHTSFAAQNLGAGQIARAKRGVRICMLIGLCAAVPFVIAYTLLSDPILLLFLNPGDAHFADAMMMGRAYLHTVAPFYAVVVIKLSYDSMTRAAGAMQYFTISTMSDLVFRVLLAYLFAAWLGPAGIWWCWGLGWVVGAAFALSFYAKGVWKRNSLTQNVL